MYLFYDTETTGLNPKKDRVVQLAALLTYPDGRKAQAFDLLLKSDVAIPAQASAVHGITDEMVAHLGVEPGGALALFDAMLERAQVAVAYNDQFDVGMLRSMFQRMDGPDYVDPFEKVQRFCACNAGAELFGRKLKLIDIHRQLLGRGFDGAHDAMSDVVACKDVFFAILEKKRARAVAA